jgi:hypothetical protein
MNGPIALGLRGALAALVVGCASGDDAPSGGGDGGVRCETDFTRLATAEHVSLRDDVMPIFGLSCTMSSCHGVDESAANLYLGPRCVYDESSPHRCTFPDSPDAAPWPPGAMPLTAEVLDAVYQGLLASSNTAPAVQLVAPRDPGASFLVDKLRGTHNLRGYDCVSLRPEEMVGPCGRAMPFGSSLCEFGSSGASQFNTIVAWVLQGAQEE